MTLTLREVVVDRHRSGKWHDLEKTLSEYGFTMEEVIEAATEVITKMTENTDVDPSVVVANLHYFTITYVSGILTHAELIRQRKS